MGRERRHFVVGSAEEQPARPVFPRAAPLLEEKRDVGGAALRQNQLDPLALHRVRSRTAFAAHDHPRDSR